MASKQPKLTNDHYTRFDLDRSTPSLWRVTFNNPPINLIDAAMMIAHRDRARQASGRRALRQRGPRLHYDIAGDPSELEGIETTAGEAPFTDLHIRLSKSPAVLDFWRSDYNGVRPHSALANRTPEEFRAQHIAVAASRSNDQNFNPDAMGDAARQMHRSAEC
jgi:transposase InsO family protein